MKKLLFLLLIVISANSYGQIETVKDSIPLFDKNNNIELRNERIDNYLRTDDASLLKEPPVAYVPDYQPLRKNNSEPIDFSLPPMYYDPFSTIFPNAINVHNLFANDYSYSAFYRLSDQAFLTTLSTQDAYPTLGAIRVMNARFGYQPTSWLQMSGGPYVSKYNVHGAHYNDIGVGGNMKFLLNDRFRVNVYGQYSAFGQRNNTGSPVVGVYPQSYYSGTVEFKITEKFGVEAGMVRELNPFNGKWETRPVISPVFYAK